jgi:hypothetical protein
MYSLRQKKTLPLRRGEEEMGDGRRWEMGDGRRWEMGDRWEIDGR